MVMRRLTPIAMLLALLPTTTVSQHSGHDTNQTPYAGQQTREIKSLSAEDIDALQQGSGWGLALPAELNGKPGPLHLIELKEALELTPAQLDAITALHSDMRKDAIAAGERFIAAEAALSDAFTRSDVTESALRGLLTEAATARADLRFVHLSRHLATPALLTDAQIQKYSVLRGYADDPCAKVPEGHNAAMWRRHNGCE